MSITRIAVEGKAMNRVYEVGKYVNGLKVVMIDHCYQHSPDNPIDCWLIIAEDPDYPLNFGHRQVAKVEKNNDSGFWSYIEYKPKPYEEKLESIARN